METFKYLTNEIDDLDLLVEEEESLSQNLASLKDNKFRLFSDCDNSNTQEQVIRSHDFGFLVKSNPFQQSSSSEQIHSVFDLPAENKVTDVSTASSSLKCGAVSINKLRILQKFHAQDKMISILHNYCPNHKTFPRGILKRGEKSKYSDTILVNETKNVQKEILGSDSVGKKFYWDSLDNCDIISSASEQSLHSSLTRRIMYSKSRKATNENLIRTGSRPSKNQVDKVRRTLYERTGC